MKEIILKHGQVTFVDDEDYEHLSQFKWRLSSHGYAVCGTSTYMHRVILNAPEGLHTDHKDGNRLMNVRANIRLCSQAENNCNQKSRKGKKTSRWKGVSWCKENGKWWVSIKHNRKAIYLGSFEREDEAAAAYNSAAEKYFGEFAQFNSV